jgi:ATP-dependent RNA helicase RhlE
MESFEELALTKQLRNAVNDMGFTTPTPIQAESFNVVTSGKDIVGIAQTGTGKTLADCLPILSQLKYSDQLLPRVLIVVPTRELVVQVTETLEELTKYMSVRIQSIFGGVNIVTQRQELLSGSDIIVATPGRLYDLVMSKSIQLKAVRKLVIDEVDVMLDLGFRGQISSLLDLLPSKRQSIMFSATMTDSVATLIEDSFIAPKTIAIALSGTPLENIEQESYSVRNFFTKVNLLAHLLSDREDYKKVLIFHSSKRSVDRMYEILDEELAGGIGVIHSNMSQNNRFKGMEDFEQGVTRILLTTDLMARGIDIDEITHVINMDVPNFPENYMHRIGRTGRADLKGKAVLLYTEKEEAYKVEIEKLMNYSIPEIEFPKEVAISAQLAPEEMPRERELNSKNVDGKVQGAFHKKSAKNSKTNEGGSYKKKIAAKYKKPQTRGDKTYHKTKRR